MRANGDAIILVEVLADSFWRPFKGLVWSLDIYFWACGATGIEVNIG
jgi:hypothetical protein